MRLIDAALVNQILHEPADGIISQRRHDRGFQSKTSLQAARDVVLAAALPDLKTARGRNPTISRIETQHHFAQTH